MDKTVLSNQAEQTPYSDRQKELLQDDELLQWLSSTGRDPMHVSIEALRLLNERDAYHLSKQVEKGNEIFPASKCYGIHPSVEQVEPKVSVPSDEEIERQADDLCPINDKNNPRPHEKTLVLIHAGFIRGAKWMRDRITSNSVPKQWISVTEKLPEEGVGVLFVENGDVIVGYYDNLGWQDADRYYKDTVTHWMPLPTPPNTESNS